MASNRGFVIPPEGNSVNDGISKDPCFLSYVSVAMAAEAVSRMGPGVLLAKVDIRSMYHAAVDSPR